MHCTIRNTAVDMWVDIQVCNVGGYFSLLQAMQIDKFSKKAHVPLKAFFIVTQVFFFFCSSINSDTNNTQF